MVVFPSRIVVGSVVELHSDALGLEDGEQLLSNFVDSRVVLVGKMYRDDDNLHVQINNGEIIHIKKQFDTWRGAMRGGKTKPLLSP